MCSSDLTGIGRTCGSPGRRNQIAFVVEINPLYHWRIGSPDLWTAACSAGSGVAEDLGKAMANVYPMKIAKKQSKSIPSTLFNIFSVALSRNISLAHISNTTDERIQSGISFRKVFRVMTIGERVPCIIQSSMY